MAIVTCMISDCKHISKRKLRTWKRADNIPCYGCTLKAITINEVFDPDGYIESVAGKENTKVCKSFEPKE